MKKVVLGMSGGVDSSAAAVLLKEQGYEVIGITFKFIEGFDATDAIEVAKKLNIEHHVVDYKEEFKNKVINKFLKDYKSGVTPNPCIQCNKDVKLQFLYDQMIKYNADYFATGHYANIKDGRLFKSVDLAKDQTYFLSLITHDELSHLLLPLEGIDKPQVRKIAEEAGLLVAHKKDSTDVCFISESFSKFITNNICEETGNIIDISTNSVLGKHNGLSHYTIGQRRGLNIGGTKNRCYVVGKDVTKNILYIACDETYDSLISDSSYITDINLFNDTQISSCKARFRYRQQEEEITIEWIDKNNAIVKYPQGIKAVTPGQACVFYIENECLGGGIIKEVRKNNNKLWYL